MKYTLKVLRKAPGEEKQYWQDFEYESESENDTVASALLKIGEVKWECSCLQKKCGACAMVIDNIPRLACDTKLSDCKSETITVQPLRKFPVISDLVVDRSILYRNLETMKTWLSQDADFGDANPDKYRELAYQGSECIQCGCCLEVCPNFYPGGSFFGMASVPLTMRLLSETDRKLYMDNAKLYRKHIYSGCGKALACKDICPRKIDTEKLLVNLNALAVWKRKKK
ncbi:MAG TPA: succinate dehydrogenase [Sphaerochaeta sp.]|nr:succinate dehydrogenase [Sphaerochaeta sp.]